MNNHSVHYWLPTILVEDPETADPMELLNAILDYGMQSAFVNVCIAMRIVLTMPVTVASAERIDLQQAQTGKELFAF